ncbi:MAG: hypothetical protein ACKESB_02760 [Candidatus Hodgkinia cicadicola]
MRCSGLGFQDGSRGGVETRRKGGGNCGPDLTAYVTGFALRE